MTNWLAFAIIAYFFAAVVAVIDKFLVHRKTRSPIVYSFYTAILSAVVLVAWPFDFSFLSIQTTLIALFSGATFFLATFFYYSTMMKGAISRSASIIGGISPIIILFLSYFLLEERLPGFWIVSFFVLIFGSFLLAYGKGKIFSVYALLAAVFYALTFFSAKLVYLDSSFINGLVWIRVGGLLVALGLLLFPFFKKILKANPLKVNKKIFLFFVANKGLSAVSILILNYAISLGPVSIINAVQGIQYGMIFILAIFVSIWFPNFIKESLEFKIVARKIIGIALVSAGIIFLVI